MQPKQLLLSKKLVVEITITIVIVG